MFGKKFVYGINSHPHSTQPLVIITFISLRLRYRSSYLPLLTVDRSKLSSDASLCYSHNSALITSPSLRH
ncbi:hypothetical protein QVD17_17268 [Tagetes erecta]|uniref:Uncharacterized protein n=1 Tax=Tagetes erecta TaxID=13708 RepID=A0AAD8P1A3_TARER|nr:hypothetical protein QVD17_17268 [Tagetes erecta]